LAAFFAKKYAEHNGYDFRGITETARLQLQAHHWRGNVRELENTIHRAVLLANGGVIDMDALLLTGGRLGPGPTPAAPPATASAAMPSGNGGAAVGMLVGRTVADVER